MKIKILFTLAFVLSSSFSVFSADRQAGQAKAAMCIACHNMDGNSAIPIYPKLAGQHQSYLEKQLREYRAAAFSGGKEGRNNPIMNAMAVGLSDEDIVNISAYYSTNKVSPLPEESEFDKNLFNKGKQLYLGGDKKRHVTACSACHGPLGKGLGSAKFPSLVQQHPAYIKEQLKNFRSRTRHNDLNGMMRMASKKLTNEDIDALVVYIKNI